MFGIDIIDASLGMSLLVATFAGVLSFLSPCVLPIVPPYLAFIGGTSINDISEGRDRSVIIKALFFVFGLSTVFLFLGFAASAFGQVFLQYQDIMGKVAGGVIILFGLHFLGILHIPFLYREARFDAGDRGGSLFGAYILGLAFAFGWTPCIGPILGTILSLAAQEASVQRGLIMMAFYAAGLGIPFILAAMFMRHFLAVMNRFKKHMGLVEKTMGVMLVIVGILLITGLFSEMSFWLLENIPMLAGIG
ncbi:MAG: cytochrome c biogenesis protein CcdA [Paracoccaceae bacterium]